MRESSWIRLYSFSSSSSNIQPNRFLPGLSIPNKHPLNSTSNLLRPGLDVAAVIELPDGIIHNILRAGASRLFDTLVSALLLVPK